MLLSDAEYSQKVDVWAESSDLWKDTLSDLVKRYVGPWDDVFDIGGNTGRLVDLLNESETNWTGRYLLIEKNPIAIRTFRARYKDVGQHPKLHSIKVDQVLPRPSDLPFVPDVIFCVQALPHMKHPKTRLEQIADMNPGYVILVYPNAWHDRSLMLQNVVTGYKKDPTYLGHLSPGRISRYAKEFGMSIVESYKVGRRAYGIPGTEQWNVTVLGIHDEVSRQAASSRTRRSLPGPVRSRSNRAF